MKQVIVVFRTVLLAVVLVLLVACEGGVFSDPGHVFAGSGFSGESGGGNRPDPDIVAKWYRSQSSADSEGSDFIFECTSDGKFNVRGGSGNMTYTARSGKLTISGEGVTVGTANYEIEGTKITLKDATEMLIAIAGFGSESFYKKK